MRHQADLERERWPLWFPILFACGIGIYFVLPTEPSKWLTLGIIEALILLSIIFKHHHKVLKFIGIFSILVFGFSWVQLRSIYVSSQIHQVPEAKLYLNGQIQNIDYNSNGKVRILLDEIKNFEGDNILGRFSITLRSKQDNLRVGQCVELVAQLMPPPSTQIISGYQIDRNTFFKRISGNGYSLTQLYETECKTNDNLSSKFQNYINNTRKSIVKHIHTILKGDVASVVSAIVAGEQGGIRKKCIEDYRNSGLAHFLSISGLHMSLITGLMFFFVRFIMALIPSLSLRFDSKKTSVGFAFLISFIYLLISGAGIPVQRAFIMTTIVLIGILFNRRAISMTSIAWAGFLVLLITPEALIGASFQMSFAAVIALIAFYEKFASPLSKWLNVQKDSLFIKLSKIVITYILGIIIADLIASIATLPFAIYHFNRIAVYTSLANLLAGPIIGLVIMPFTLFSLLMMPLGLDTYFLKVVGFGVSLVNDITSLISGWEGSSLQVLSPPLWGFMLIVFGGLWMCIWERKWRWWGGLFVIIGMLSITTVHRPDILISANNEVIALKDNNDNMVILPSHGNRFTKHIWMQKTASISLSQHQKKELKKLLSGKELKLKWIDLECEPSYCTYKNIVKIYKDKRISINDKFIPSAEYGASIYLSPNVKVETVRGDVGYRLWHQ